MQDALNTWRDSTHEPHPIEKQAPRAPERFEYLLRYFHLAARGRPFHTGGWMPLPATEIEAAMRLIGVRLSRWEVDAILRLDDCWREVMSDKSFSFDE